MTVDELERQQQEVRPKEDLSPFAGKWVALRDGLVIASDLTVVALRDHPEVRADDVLGAVPPGGSGVYIL